MEDTIYWNKEHLDRINEAIEFDVVSSIEFVNVELKAVIKGLARNEKVFICEDERITTLDMFKDFILIYIEKPNYFIERLLK